MTTPQQLPYGTSIGTGGNADSWAKAILSGLGAPSTSANINSLVDWMDQEGGGGVNNPLNVANAPDSTGEINSVGVDNFGSPSTGVQQTVARLQEPFASAILDALKSGGGLIGNTNAEVASALSAWSGGGYSSVGGSSAYKGGSSAPPASSATSYTGTQSATTSTDTSTTGLIGFAEGLPFGIGAMFKGFEPVLHAIATVIDYSFSMFQPGQGQRLLFALAMIALAFLAYKILASTGAVPDLHPAAAI